MRSSSITYLVKEGIKNVWLNRLMAIASIGVLTACLIIVGTTFLIAENLNNIIKFAEQQNEIVVFLKDEATNEQIEDMEKELNEKGNIISVVFKSKEKVLEDMKKNVGSDEIDIFEGIEPDIFPSSFHIKIDNMAYLGNVINDIKSYEIVIAEDIIAPDDVASTIVDIKNTINKLGFIMIGILIIVSVVIISNTIRATVYARRKEIGIMRYVGATNNFIRIPFLVEGIILGLISAMLSYFAIQSAYKNIIDMLMAETTSFLSYLKDSFVPFENMSLTLIVYFIISGIFLGSAGTLFSLKSHLKV